MTATVDCMAQVTHPLDAVVRHALEGRQRHLSVGDGPARRFRPDVAPFATFRDPAALRRLIAATGPAALVTAEAPASPDGLAVARQATVLQMVWQGGGDGSAPPDHVRLGDQDVADMMALASATQPGPFAPRTIAFGTYLGIRRQGRLVAMAGERLRVDGHTEVSAVCVDPAHRGQGLATGLMRRLIAGIAARGETPFLHVLTSNGAAIAIYRRMGFADRRPFHFTVLTPAGTP